MRIFIRFIDLKFLIILIILCILMFLIIAFRKCFRNVMHGHFSLNFLVRNTNLKHELKIFLGMFTRRKMRFCNQLLQLFLSKATIVLVACNKN